MRGHNRFRAALVLSCVSAISGGSAWSQDPNPRRTPPAQQPPAEQPTFRAEANFVRVDVLVTAGGAPVRNLKAGDFELFEDGAPQKIATFEHVDIRATALEERRDPQSVLEMRAEAADPHNRIYILFLDTYHVDISASYYIRRPIVNMINRLVGPQDLFAIMTPQMSAADIALARRTEAVEAMLARHWAWGQRNRLVDPGDEVEEAYRICYPDAGCTGGVAREMIARRRERHSLDALEDVIRYSRGLRDERKAVIVISSGWLLFRPDGRLADLGTCEEPTTGPRIGVDPSGRLRTDPQQFGLAQKTRLQCDNDRRALAALDNRTDFYQMLDDANRANVSFYAMDPRGLAASDTGVVESAQFSPRADQLRLTNRLETLHTMAESTDGLATTTSNDLERSMRRITDDLSSYYLIGYYSTNAKLDGKFRSISVRVTRPGVDVRARRGYRAATQKELSEARVPGTERPSAAVVPALDAALGALAVRPDQPIRTAVAQTIYGPDAAKAGVWVVVELDPATQRSDAWKQGGLVEASLGGPGLTGAPVATSTLPPGARGVSIAFPNLTVEPGEYRIRISARPALGNLPLADTVAFNVTAPDIGPPPLGTPLLKRALGARPTTATADPRFRRIERIGVEIPVGGAVGRASVQLLDRAGRVVPVPIEAKTTAASEGLSWVTTEFGLAPLAPADYVLRFSVERSGTTEERLVAFRVVP